MNQDCIMSRSQHDNRQQDNAIQTYSRLRCSFIVVYCMFEIQMLQVRFPAMVPLHNDSGQVVPEWYLSSSSIIRYWCKTNAKATMGYRRDVVYGLEHNLTTNSRPSEQRRARHPSHMSQSSDCAAMLCWLMDITLTKQTLIKWRNLP